MIIKRDSRMPKKVDYEKASSDEELSQEYNQILKDKYVYKYRNIEALSKSDLLAEIEQDIEKTGFPYAKNVLVDIISGELENKYGVKIVDAKIAPEVDDFEEEDYIDITEEELNAISEKEESEKYFKVLNEDNYSIDVEIFQMPSKEEYVKFFTPYLEDKDKLHIKYGPYWISIYNGSTGFDLGCGEVWNWYKTFEETYDGIANIDEEIKKADERQKEALDSTEKFHNELIEKVSKANDDMGIQEFARLCNSIDVYSDIYKDSHGFRPRGECHELFETLAKNAPTLDKEYIDMSFEEKLNLVKE